MTRKAHNVNRERTERAQFRDPRSYWTNAGHMYVFGADAQDVRTIAFEMAKGRCEECGIAASLNYGELDHIKGGNTDDRCWCADNLQWLCRTCHRKKHVRPMWGPEKVKTEAHKEELRRCAAWTVWPKREPREI